MKIRELSGMTYKAIELEHPVKMSMSEVLFNFATWISSHDQQGILTGLHTGLQPDDESKFITVLLWSPQ